MGEGKDEQTLRLGKIRGGNKIGIGNMAGERSCLRTDEPETAKRYQNNKKMKTEEWEKKGSLGMEKGKDPKPTNKKKTLCEIPQPPAASDTEVRRRPVRGEAIRKIGKGRVKKLELWVKLLVKTGEKK